jgi:hypothetical protein
MARHKYIQKLFAVIEFVIIFLFIAFLLTTTVPGLLRVRRRSRVPKIMPLPQSSNRLATGCRIFPTFVWRSFYRCNAVTLLVQIQQNRKVSGKVAAASNKSVVKRHYSKLLFAALALIPAALLAQNLTATPGYSDQAELSKVEEWVLSQGTEESIAPELAAILGLGSDRLPVKLKSFRTAEGVDLTFAVSTNPKQKGIVISALKTMTDKMEIYSTGTAWLTDKSGTLRQTIAVDASGAKVLPNNSRAAKFKDLKDFFIKKCQASSPATILSPSPRISATAAKKNSP